MHPSAADRLAIGAESLPVADRLAILALVALVAFQPVIRGIETLILPYGSSTAVARLNMAVFELLFLAAVSCSPGIALPRPGDLGPKARLLLVIWLAWSALATALADAPAIALLRQTTWLVHGMTALALWRLLAAHPHWRSLWLKAVVLGFLLYGVAMAFVLVHLPDDPNFPWLGAMLGFRNIRHFSDYAAVAVIAALVPLMGRQWPQAAALPARVATLTIAWGFLFWSGGRAAVLSVAVALAVAFALRWMARPLPSLAIIGATALLGLGLSIPLTPPNASYGILRIADAALPTDGLEIYGSGRLDMWRQAAGLVVRHPLLGLGPDNYAMAAKGAWWNFEHPHDIALQAALDWGIPGALLFLAGLVWLMVAAFRRNGRRGDETGRGATLMALTLLVISLVAGPLYYGFSTMLFLMALAVAFSGDERPPGARSRRHTWQAATLAATAVMLLLGLGTCAIALPREPAPDSWRVTILRRFPAALEMDRAGERLNAWAVQWHRQGNDAALPWLQWTAAHSRTPWTSLYLAGTWRRESGDTAGRALIDTADRLRPPDWSAPGGNGAPAADTP